MSLINLQDISLGFGGHPLLDGVRLTIESGERVCLLGRNGSGKSTLLKLINGEILPDSGDIIRRQGVRISRLTQEVDPGLSGRIYEVVAEKRARESDPLDEEWEIRPQVETILSRMDLDPKAEFNALSAGLKRRVLLARALVADPDLLLLDEPTNHLDIGAIRWLEEFLLRHVKTLLFVTHDRMFLRKLATRIIELDRGRLRSWNCDYDTFLE
ncbi:MAG: ATP-binding cassette domain-containing protein, partial [Thermodesulfobacteriota bacterium]